MVSGDERVVALSNRPPGLELRGCSEAAHHSRTGDRVRGNTAARSLVLHGMMCGGLRTARLSLDASLTVWQRGPFCCSTLLAVARQGMGGGAARASTDRPWDL